MTYAEFILQFPEFTKLTQAQVEVYIAQAEDMLDEDAFGDMYELAVAYKAADSLALSPFSQHMRMVNKDGMTTYGEFFRSSIRPRNGRRGMVL